MRTMYLRPQLRQYQVDRPTHDIISPRLVEGPERLRPELKHASGDVVVLFIGARAAILYDRAESSSRCFFDDEVGKVDPRRDRGPGLKIGNPCLVFENCAIAIKLPESNLKKSVSTVSSSVDV